MKQQVIEFPLPPQQGAVITRHRGRTAPASTPTPPFASPGNLGNGETAAKPLPHRRTAASSPPLWLCLHFPHLPLEVMTRGTADATPVAIVEGEGSYCRVRARS